MKSGITIFLICFTLNSFCQTGKVKIDIKITDTVRPYFLDISAHNDNTLASKLTVIENGIYYISNLKEGKYSFEFHSFESRSRRLYINNVTISNDSTITLKVVYPAPCKFVYSEADKPLCPYNHSNKVIKIVYGFPVKETIKKAKKGLIRLGGCEITDCDPHYYCIIHDREF